MAMENVYGGTTLFAGHDSWECVLVQDLSAGITIYLQSQRYVWVAHQMEGDEGGHLCMAGAKGYA